MNKSVFLCASFCVALAFTSCKSSESAYRKAYDKAQAQASASDYQTPVQSQQTYETPVVTPLETRPATQNTVMDNGDNVRVRQESVTIVSGAGLKNFSVVVGSFGLKANAEGLQNNLKNAGYPAQIALNSSNMYRVIATTFDTKGEAVASRDALRANYPDAWLLYNK